MSNIKSILQYQNLNSIVKAIKVSIDNYKDVLRVIIKESIENNISYLNYNIDVNKNDFQLSYRYAGSLLLNQLKIGDYLVRLDGILQVLSAEKFLSSYSLVPEGEPTEPTSGNVRISEIDLTDFTPSAKNITTFVKVKTFDENNNRTSQGVQLTITKGNAKFAATGTRNISFVSSKTEESVINVIIEDLTVVPIVFSSGFIAPYVDIIDGIIGHDSTLDVFIKVSNSYVEMSQGVELDTDAASGLLAFSYDFVSSNTVVLTGVHPDTHAISTPPFHATLELIAPSSWRITAVDTNNYNWSVGTTINLGI
jgi:hypothetical protein